MCHAMNSVVIGPPYVAITSRYSMNTNKDALVEVLANKIVLGGGGNWGTVPMVQNGSRVTLDEARRLVKWILNLPTPK